MSREHNPSLGAKSCKLVPEASRKLVHPDLIVHSTVPSLGLRRLRCVVLLHRKARVGQDATHVRQTTCVPQVCPAGASRGLGIKGDSRSLVTKSCARLSKTSISTACHRHRSCDLFERRNPWVGCMLVSLGAWVLGCLVGQRTYPVTGFRVCMGACVCCHARIPDTLCAVSRCTPHLSHRELRVPASFSLA